MDTTEVILSLTVLVLVGAAAFLALAETALTRTWSARAEALVRTNRRGSRQLIRLVAQPERFLSPILLLVLICQLVAATLVGVLAGRHLTGLGVAVVTTTEVIIVFITAEAAPKTWALRHLDRAALLVAPPIGLLLRLPPVRILTAALIGLADLVLPGKGVPRPPAVSEAELRAMATLAARERVIEPEEQTLIEAILAFGDTLVREIMVPRTDMTSIAATATLDEARERVLTSGFSRFPVVADAPGQVVGILYAKDLLAVDADTRSKRRVGDMVRSAHFVPETKRVSELLAEMQARRVHMAIVADEFGGTAGLVTLEDIVEELVGEIRDEYDTELPLVQTLPQGFRVNARLPVDDLNELLDAEFAKEEWDTVGGLLLGLLGHVPHPGEGVESQGFRFVVEQATARRVQWVRVTPVADHARPTLPTP